MNETIATEVEESVGDLRYLRQLVV